MQSAVRHKTVYAIQGTLLGSKAKSLAVIIPARVARELAIDHSTILALTYEKDPKRIMLQPWNREEDGDDSAA